MAKKTKFLFRAIQMLGIETPLVKTRTRLGTQKTKKLSTEYVESFFIFIIES